MKTRKDWLDIIGKPENDNFPRTRTLIKRYDCGDFEAELFLQANGIRKNGQITYQRLLMAFPKERPEKCPAVAVPFYYPEATLGFDPENMAELPKFADNPTLLDLVRRGYVAATADAYHLTYIEGSRQWDDFSRWRAAAQALLEENPNWTGVGKLIADTRLVLDALAEDPRVDAERIGIAGHSLGGKMAFYTGCLDDRVKAILASDFGIGWEQTNWQDIWYWGEKKEAVKAAGFCHSSLLNSVAPKPFCLLAGYYDNEESREILRKADGYRDCPERLLVINHATGHRPPRYIAAAGYGFLDYWLKNQQ